MVILLCYTSAFIEVIYADFYAKILDWNFRLVDANSQILVFVSKLNFSFSFSFRFVDEHCWILVVVVVFVTKIIYFRQRKFSFSSSWTKKHWSSLMWSLKFYHKSEDSRWYVEVLSM